MFVGDPVKQCWNQYFGETDALVELPTSAVQSEDLSGNAALFTYVRLANRVALTIFNILITEMLTRAM